MFVSCGNFFGKNKAEIKSTFPSGSDHAPMFLSSRPAFTSLITNKPARILRQEPHLIRQEARADNSHQGHSSSNTLKWSNLSRSPLLAPQKLTM